MPGGAISLKSFRRFTPFLREELRRKTTRRAAMRDIDLPSGTPLTYLKQLIWVDVPDRNIFAPKQDRFYAYADKALVNQVQLAAQQNEFAPELDPAAFHIGATSSYKQIQFGEANVQLTFHEGDTQIIDGPDGMPECPSLTPLTRLNRPAAALKCSGDRKHTAIK